MQDKGFADLWNCFVPTCKCLYLHVLFYTLGYVRTTPYKQIQTGTYYRFYYPILSTALHQLRRVLMIAEGDKDALKHTARQICRNNYNYGHQSSSRSEVSDGAAAIFDAQPLVPLPLRIHEGRARSSFHIAPAYYRALPRAALPRPLN
jgi:hypothetical protein